MKRLTFYRSLLLIMFALIGLCFFVKCDYSKSNPGSDQKGDPWYESHVWLSNLQLTPDKSINQREFSNQYHKSKIWWDEAINFLKTHDLNTIEVGEYIIDTGNVIATVSEGTPKDINQIEWEAHRNFNDLQYIIKGSVKMGISSTDEPDNAVKKSYDPQTDSEIFTVSEGSYYEARPGTFFIFSPREIHRPAIKINGYNEVKKIVIKVRVP